MMTLLTRWVLMTVAVMLAAQVLKPGILVKDPLQAFLAAVVLSLLNAVVRPILLLLTLPINILTLGLFTFLINGFLFWLTSRLLSGGIEVHGAVPAVVGALFISVVSGLLNWLLGTRQKSPQEK